MLRKENNSLKLDNQTLKELIEKRRQQSLHAISNIIDDNERYSQEIKILKRNVKAMKPEGRYKSMSLQQEYRIMSETDDEMQLIGKEVSNIAGRINGLNETYTLNSMKMKECEEQHNKFRDVLSHL